MKLQASSLMYALMITLLIALLSSMFISMVHLNHIRVDMLGLKERLIRNCNSGMEIALHDTEGPEQEYIDLFQEGIDSVLIERKYWGAYRLLKVNSFFKGEQITRTALAGEHTADQLTLYLADKNRALNVCGKTEIKGDAYLPPLGIKRAYIEGKTYIGSELVYGSKYLSEKYLPGLNLEMLSKIYDEDVLEKYSFLDKDKKNLPVAEQSFSKPTLCLYEGEILNVEGSYKGNIIIVADSVVEISASAKLEDVLVYAPVIKVQEGFSGKLQMFASDSIHIGKNCNLAYPSVVGCYHKDKEVHINILENTIVEGMVFCKGKLKKRSFAKHMFLDKNTALLGELYVEGANVEMRSNRVIGTSYCDRFVLHTKSSVYENHLIDVELNSESLPKSYAVSALSLSDGEKTLVKWLP